MVLGLQAVIMPENQINLPMLQLLSALCTGRDESSLVGIEAIRALAGHFPPRKASLGLDGKVVEVSAQDVRCRGRAWQASCCSFLGVGAGL